MMIGIGCDLCQISRMEALLVDDRFLNRYFGAREREYINSRGSLAASSMAAGFAAKEAFAKALGLGFDGISPQEILVLRRENGAPYYELLGNAKQILQQKGANQAHLSISHEGGLALAFCVLEG